jgi:transposase
VINFLAEGLTKEAVAEKVGISVSSVYRIAKTVKESSAKSED